MGGHISSHSILGNVTFKKSGMEIVVAATHKCDALTAKVNKRMERVHKLREENNIDDAALAELYRLAARNEARGGTYALSNARVLNSQSQNEEVRHIPVSVVSAIQSEMDNIENEREQQQRLDLIVRNIDRDVLHTVTHFDLEYLGF